MRKVLLMSVVCVFALTVCFSLPGLAQGKRLKVAMIPKAITIDYFTSCYEGAKEAAEELGIDLTYDGPDETKADLQISYINNWISQKYDVICVSANDPAILAPVMKRAQAAGVKVITFDADAQKDARTFMVQQATAEGIGFKLLDQMVLETGKNATIGIVTASLTDANQNAWIDGIKERIAQKYPGIKIAAILPGEHTEAQSISATRKLLKNYPDITGIIAPNSVAFPAAAKVIQEEGLAGKIAVVGLNTPNGMKPYVSAGVVKSVVLWNTLDLGYLTMYVAKGLAEGTLKPGAKSMRAGKLGRKEIVGDEVLLGDPFVFTPENIDQFNF